MSTEKDESSQLDSLILGEIQVLLSEKRTALSIMRTGIAVFALPLSGPECADRDLTLLQHRKGDAAAHAPAAFEPWAGCARHVARLPFDRPPSPLRSSHPRADPEISVARGGCGLTQTNMAAFSAGGTSRVRELGNKGTLASGNACPTGLLFNSSTRRRS